MLNRINLIRAVACLLIAIFHAVVFLNAMAPAPYIDVSSLSAPGFHLFLLITGVVLTYTLRPDEKPLRFLVKRLARLAPLYWIVTLAVIALASWRPWTFGNADLSLTGIATSLLFIPHADLQGEIRPILFVGWTLSYLVLLYALFAGSLLLPRRWRAAAIIASLLTIMAAAPLLPTEALRRFYANPILLEYAAGVILGQLLFDPRVAAWIKTRSMTPFIVVGLTGMIIIANSNLGGLTKALAYCTTGALAVFGAIGADLYQKPLKSKLAKHAGAASYAMLLVHPLLVPLVAAPIEARIDDMWLKPIIILPVYLSLSIAAAFAVHRWVESPINDMLRRRLASPRSAERSEPPLQGGTPQRARDAAPSINLPGTV